MPLFIAVSAIYLSSITGLGYRLANMSVKLDLELAAPRGAPKTRASLARLRECLAGLVGRMRARCVANHLVKAGILPHVPNDERRLSAPVTTRQAAIALVT